MSVLMLFQFLIRSWWTHFPNYYLHCSRIILEPIWQTVALINYCFLILLWHTVHIICSIFTFLSALIQSCKFRCSHYLLYITKFIVTRSRKKNRILSECNENTRNALINKINWIKLFTYWSNVYFNFISIGYIHKLFNWEKWYYVSKNYLWSHSIQT